LANSGYFSNLITETVQMLKTLPDMDYVSFGQGWAAYPQLAG